MDIFLKIMATLSIITLMALVVNAAYCGLVDRLRIAAESLLWSSVCGWCLYAIAWVWL